MLHWEIALFDFFADVIEFNEVLANKILPKVRIVTTLKFEGK
jgi:hypothetical protein